MSTRASKIARVGRLGFTLTELLVVIAVLVAVVLVGLPAFSSMLSGSERTLAINQLKIGLSAARDAAIRGDNVDSAAVFFFEPNGRVRVVPCVFVGRITDRRNPAQAFGPNNSVERDVFAPVGTVEATTLPRGWSVRGYAAPNLLHQAGNQLSTIPPNGWYEPVANGTAQRDVDRDSGSWVFPETGFVADGTRGNLLNSGGTRQTFMVRFEGGTGEVKSKDQGPVLVLDHRPVGDGVRVPRTAANLWQRPDLATNQAVWARRLIARGLAPQQVQDFLGDRSADTVLAASTDLLALYDEARMAASIGARGVNRDTGTIYAPGIVPGYDTTLFNGLSGLAIQVAIDEWLTGELRRNGEFVESDALIYTFDRFTGALREIKP